MTPLPAMSAPPPAGRVVTGRYEGPAGARAWRLYVPSAHGDGTARPLLVLLHGCTQDAADLARGTRMDAVAEEQGFLVLYPEQAVADHPRRCWNWYEPAHQGAAAGEPALLAAMAASVAAQYGADRGRVHVAGISAGGAMALLVAAAHPAQFASAASASGVAWRAATSVGAALGVMQRGGGATVPDGAALAAAMGPAARAVPLLVIHGDRDAIVAPANADEAVRQWVSLHDHLAGRAGHAPLVEGPVERHTAGGYAVRETAWRDARGVTQVRAVRVAELGHAWAGGSPDGTFTDASGPDASRLIAAFCAAHRLPGS